MTMSTDTDAVLRSPEGAKLLGVSAEDVYRLIFDGELEGRPDDEGIVYITRSSVDAYRRDHGQGAVQSRA
jgi:hypothetical protein